MGDILCRSPKSIFRCVAIWVTMGLRAESYLTRKEARTRPEYVEARATRIRKFPFAN